MLDREHVIVVNPQTQIRLARHPIHCPPHVFSRDVRIARVLPNLDGLELRMIQEQMRPKVKDRVEIWPLESLPRKAKGDDALLNPVLHRWEAGSLPHRKDSLA